MTSLIHSAPLIQKTFEYANSPPSVSHLSDPLNNQEMFNSWWNWRLCNMFGGSRFSSPPSVPIPCESITKRHERIRIWNEIADKADKQAKRLYQIENKGK